MEISTFFKSEEDIIEKLLKKKKQMDYKLNVPSNKIIIAGRKGNIQIANNYIRKIKTGRVRRLSLYKIIVTFTFYFLKKKYIF